MPDPSPATDSPGPSSGPDHGSGSGSRSKAFPKRACFDCARSKLKCRWLDQNQPTRVRGRYAKTCERCARLKLPCWIPEPAKKGPRIGSKSRVGQLEDKLDGIMTLLAASRQLDRTEPLTHVSSQPPVAESEGSPSACLTSSVQPSTADNSEALACGGLPNSLPPGHSISATEVEIHPGYSMLLGDAESVLSTYRDDYVPLFPFVPISPGVSAYELFEKHPFLFRTIIHIVSPQPTGNTNSFKPFFLRQIAREVVVKQTKNIELLQAILIYIAWGHFHFYIESSATQIMQIAVGLAIDLGLTKAPNTAGVVPSTLVYEAMVVAKGLNLKTAHSTQEKRAVLGCFVVATIPCVFFRKMHQMPLTSYMSQCCESLADGREYPSDAFLACLVRMQRRAVRMCATFPSPEADDEAPLLYHEAVHMTMSSMQRELELELLAQGQAESIDSGEPLVCAYYHGILMRLYESAMAMRSPAQRAGAGVGAAGGTVRPASARRTEALWSCLREAQAVLDAFLRLPVDRLPVLPVTAASLLSFAIVTLSRLLFLDDPDWDVGVARRATGFAALAQRLSDRFDEADAFILSAGAGGTAAGRLQLVEDGRSNMALYRRKLLWIKRWYVAKVPDEQQQQQQQQQQQTQQMQQQTQQMQQQPSQTQLAETSSARFMIPSAPVPVSAAMPMSMPTEMDQDFAMPLIDESGFDGVFWQALLSMDGPMPTTAGFSD